MSHENVASTENAGNDMDARVVSGEHSVSITSSDGTPSRSSADKYAFREGDWTCIACGANVFGRNISCFRCLSPKPGTNARHGDWICLNKVCSAHNYANRHTCYRCHVPKGSEKPGDWPCPNCFSNNFANRSECFRCRLPRPPGFGMNVQVRPGDWLCPNPSCGSNVFANRDNCYRCKTPRPIDAEVAATFSDMRVGDWTCPDCHSMCYANRQTCFRCEKQRPSDAQMKVPSELEGHHHFQGKGVEGSHFLHTSPMHASSMPAGEATSYQSAVASQYHYAYAMGYNPYAIGYFQQYYTHPPPRMGMHPTYPGNAVQYTPREGDWVCVKCKEPNFARRIACFKCKEPRGSSLDSQTVENGHVNQRPSGAGAGSEPHHSNTVVSAQ